ncbi:MAG: RNHCP domain-containing protein [Candidatus Micrarchaeaceae archaeon]
MAKFRRNIEDFVCINCGAKVVGSGYTDHCPKCLASVHRDINPGDRLSDCGGVMLPIRRIYMRTYTVLVYRCGKCGIEKRVRCAPDDSEQAIMSVSPK